MTVFNGAKAIERAIQSIVNQTVKPAEIIIINDASTDDTPAILQRLANRHAVIKVLEMPQRSKPQRRTGMALNLALKNTTQPYIAWMDADDVSLPHRFEKQLDWLLQHPDHVGCGSQVIWKDYRWFVPKRYSNLHLRNAYLRTFSVKQTPVFQQTAFFRADFIKHNQLQYDKTIAYAEDFDFFSRAIRMGQIGNLPDRLVEYHLHPAQSIQQNGPHLQSVENTIIQNLTHFTGQAPREWVQYLNHRACESWQELKQCIDTAAQTQKSFTESLKEPLAHIDELWKVSLQQKITAAMHRNPEWLPNLKEEYPAWHAQLGWMTRGKIALKKLLKVG